jgi:hypothetical protein
MSRSRRLTTVGVLAIVVALGLAFTAGASAKRVKRVKLGHVIITFSGQGAGNYSTSAPEQDISPGVCAEPSNAAMVVDRFTFGEKFKLTFPDGAGNPVGMAVKAGGNDLSSGSRSACTNGFGNLLGGTSYSCTTPFIKAYSSQGNAPFPTVELSGSGRHFEVTVTGGVEYGPNPVGTNCVGAPIGGGIYSFAYKLNGQLKFSAAQLAKHHSLSTHVNASRRATCGSTTCDTSTCANDISSPGPVPVMCSTVQNYSGDLKIQLVK